MKQPSSLDDVRSHLRVCRAGGGAKPIAIQSLNRRKSLRSSLAAAASIAAFFAGGAAVANEDLPADQFAAYQATRREQLWGLLGDLPHDHKPGEPCRKNLARRSVSTLLAKPQLDLGADMNESKSTLSRKVVGSPPYSAHFLESLALFAIPLLMLSMPMTAEAKPRARDLGVPFEGEPGPLNAITDVKGGEVGHVTLISGDRKLEVGSGPVRTGVTAILPRGKASTDPVFAAWFALNGNGEMTGTAWIEESGFLEGPILITNTSSVGVVRDAVVNWWAARGASHQPWILPVVAETYDGYLNDTHGSHVKVEHAVQAIEQAATGHVAEGNVGGGTGMTCFEFKGGIGTASRRVALDDSEFTVGVLVQANFGLRSQLQIAGVPVGREIPEGAMFARETGSIIIILATDAELLPHQLKRLARRATHGLARTGSTSGNSSGDLFLAYSTANPLAATRDRSVRLNMLPNEQMDPLFDAAVQATEESIVNALVAAETMTGRDGHQALALPHDQLQMVLEKYNRLVKPTSATSAFPRRTE